MQTSTIADEEAQMVVTHGLCPRCRDRFDCTGWGSRAAPACPRCGTRAQQVVRDDPECPTALVTELWMG